MQYFPPLNISAASSFKLALFLTAPSNAKLPEQGISFGNVDIPL